MKSSSTTALLAVTLLCTACGTYNLGNVYPQAGKSKDQQQLDTLTCKDQARIAANTGERQAGSFLLGMTIIGTPVAWELEKAKSREVFTACMEQRGYRVTAAKDGQT